MYLNTVFKYNVFKYNVFKYCPALNECRKTVTHFKFFRQERYE